MSDFSFLKSWLLARKPVHHQSMLDEFEQFFTYVLSAPALWFEKVGEIAELL